MEKQSEPQVFNKFFRHLLRFFVDQRREPAGTESGGNDLNVGADVPILVELLRAAGFSLKYSDQSEVTSPESCKVIVVCGRSGRRMVLEAPVSCCCISEDARRNILKLDSVPQQETISDSDQVLVTVSEPSEPPAPLIRQNTWSRENEAQPTSDQRRLSCPIVRDSFHSVTGDDFNVMAATDMIQEALALLNRAQRSPKLRPSMRRASSDAFLMPRQPAPRLNLSRTSSLSSGLGSSKSTSSLSSSSDSSSKSVGTPRPSKPSGAIRRTVTAMASVKSRVDSVRKGPPTVEGKVMRRPATVTKVSPRKTAAISKPVLPKTSSIRVPGRIQDNSKSPKASPKAFPPRRKLLHDVKDPVSPTADIESIKL